MVAIESSLPRPSAWSRLVPTSLAAGEPSLALLVQTRRSTTQPTLPRLLSVRPWTGRERRTKAKTKTTGTLSAPGRDKRLSNSLGARNSRRDEDEKRLRRQKTQATKTQQLSWRQELEERRRRKKDSGDKDLGRSVRPTFVAPRSAPFLAPPLSLSLHPAPCGGTGESVLAQGQGIIPPK